MGKIIMPKNSALLEEVEAALKIYYDANDWLSNDEYKRRLKEKIGDGQDESAYTKKMQITSYFGFTKWKDINDKRSLRRITESGRTFYEHIRDKNKDGILEDLMSSLETTTFGRGNYGCPDSDSDIEAPNVFARSIVELGYLTYREFAYLLWKIEDVGDTYTDALREVRQRRNQSKTDINVEAQKYSDAKPIMVLVRWGFLAEDDDDSTGGKHIILSPTVESKYKNRIKNLKIYNVDRNIEIVTDEPLKEIDTSGLTKYVVSKVKDSYSNAELENIFKQELAKYPTNKWIGVMYLGIKYGHVISGQDAKEILDAIGMAPTAITEYTKGKSLAETVVPRDSLIPAGDGNISQEKEEVDVRQLILDRYHARTDFDIVAIRQKYAKFKSLYSKQALLALNGIDLLKRLFAPKDMDENSLTYNLEHNSYYGEFGGIGGGSQFKYPLYFYSKKQKWCTGPSLKSQTELTEEEAIEKAEEIRTKFVALFDLIESTDLTHVENYALIQNLLNSDSLYRKIWVFKYLHMLYPDKFSNFYSWEWLIKVTKFLGLSEGSSLMMNGEISSFAAEIRIPNVFLAQIIHELLPSVDDDNIDETDDENETEEEEETMIIELPERSPRTYKKYPLNLVLYGAPGTGKTYSTMELACSIFDRGSASIDDICEGNTHSNRAEVMEHYNSLVKQGFITFTTFHQSYGYEDFIQGLRPDDKSESLKFVPVDGVFKKIVNRAIKDQTNNYVIIIDEINRANISKVLGELITLLETDKRWGEINQLSTKLPSGQPFAVPNNLYVIGTMNSADKSISLIDAALRRRFEFVEVSVNYKTIANSTARSVLKKINEKLEGQLDSSDLLVGHAYFIGKDEDTICDVLNHNVIPLLYEYFFDSKAKVKDILKYALDGLNYEIEDEAGKRLRVIKKAE